MNLLRAIDRIFPPKIAYAHCDIPCGIYESDGATLAAHTVHRMVEIIDALPKDGGTVKDRNNFARCVRVKDEHAAKCKHELFTLWADFFKEEHLEKFPDLHDKFWKAIKLCSKNKHEVSMEDAKALEAAVAQIAEMFKEVRVESKEDLGDTVSDSFASPKQKILGAS